MPIKSLIFGKRESARGSGIETLIFSLFNALMNFARSVIVAARYGASATSDAYYASVNILNAPAALLSDSVTALVLPRYLERKRKDEEKGFLLSYLSAVVSCFIVLTAGFLVFGKRITMGVLHGFEPGTLATVDRLVLLSLPTIVLAPVNVVLSNVLKAEKYFIFGNLGSALNSFVSVALLFFLARLGVAGIVVATLVGVAINLALVTWAIVKKKLIGGRLDLVLGFKELRSALPLLAGGLLGVASSYAEKYFISFLDAGSMTVLNMSGSLAGVAQGLLVGALISVYYPFISAAIVEGDKARFEALMKTARRLVFGVFGLAVTCMIAFAQPLFTLLFGHGRFDREAVASLSRLFGTSAFVVIYAAIANLADFAFYAKGNTITPVTISMVTTTTGAVLLQWLLVRPFGALGIVAGRCLATAANFLLLSFLLRRRHGLALLGGRDAAIAVLILILCLAAGAFPWSPWFMALPALYYLGITFGVYRLDPQSAMAFLRGNRNKPVVGTEGKS